MQTEEWLRFKNESGAEVWFNLQITNQAHLRVPLVAALKRLVHFSSFLRHLKDNSPNTNCSQLLLNDEALPEQSNAFSFSWETRFVGKVSLQHHSTSWWCLSHITALQLRFCDTIHWLCSPTNDTQFMCFSQRRSHCYSMCRSCFMQIWSYVFLCIESTYQHASQSISTQVL